MGFRVGLNMADAGVDRRRLRGRRRRRPDRPRRTDLRQLPRRHLPGDTYGPVNYYAYVPFELIWPWSGNGTTCPPPTAPRSPSTSLTFGLLLLLGIRIRPGPAGRRLAAILAFGWAAYPYTAYALESNSNDSLVAAAAGGDAARSWRGPLSAARPLALATWAKFAPLLLAPMLLTYDGRKPALELARSSSPRLRALVSRRRRAALAGDRPRPEVPSTTARSRSRPAADSPFASGARCRWLEPLRTRDPARHRRPGALRSPSARAEVAAPGGCPRRGADDRRCRSPCTTGSTSTSSGSTRCCWSRWRAAWSRAARPDALDAGGAGTITCSIESASPRWLTSTTAPITQTSSSAVSKRVGIWVISEASACSGLTPRTLVPGAGHADVGDEGGALRAARGRRRSGRGCGCRARRRRGRRGASPSPPSRWSPRRGSRRSPRRPRSVEDRVDRVEGRARDLAARRRR